MQQVGVLGASFNPPTLGHQDVVNQALQHFDRILLVPSYHHPFDKSLAPIKNRLAMLTLFLDFWPHDLAKIGIDNIEEEIQQQQAAPQPIYTFDVLTALEKKYQEAKQPVTLRFIIGPDNAAPEIWQKFYRYQEIADKWPPFVVKQQLPIRSTEVRAIIAQQANDSSELKKTLIPLVGERIAEYIIQHRSDLGCYFFSPENK